MPGQRSVSIGVWLGLGSRHDPSGKAGLAHLYEHMVFKGTRLRSSSRVSRELEEVGGHLNAFTSREQTCFYAKVLDRDQDRAVSLLCDLVTDARLGKRDLAREREVVLEEIRGCDDDPEELASDLFARGLWADNRLGDPIAGTVESVADLSVDDLLAHRDRSLSDEFPLLVCAAGAVDHDRLVAIAARGLESRPAGFLLKQKVPASGRKSLPFIVVEKDVSQVNLILSRRSLSATDPQRHALGLVNLVLGGGMASRLNQELREKRGMAYSIYSFADQMLGTGALGISMGTEPGKVPAALEAVSREIRKLREGGLSPKDRRFAMDYASGSAVLALESPSARMQNLGRSQLLYGRPMGLEEIMQAIHAVTEEDLNSAIHEYLPDLRKGNGWCVAAVVPTGFRGISLPR